MYSYDDIKILEKELKRFLLYFLLTTILFIGVLIVICTNWGTELDPYRLPSWPAYTVGIIYAVFAVYAWSFAGIKIIKYRAFVYSVLTGLDRIMEGKIVSINKNKVIDNDLEFYSIELEVKQQENRQLYLDAQKDVDIFEVEKKVQLKIFGNYIKDIIS